MYFSDDGEVMAVRVGDYRFSLAVQRATKMMQWAEPLVKLRIPLIFNLRRDPFERADFNSNTYFDWMVITSAIYLMQATVAAEIRARRFPPRQKPASFNLDAVLAQVSSQAAMSDRCPSTRRAEANRTTGHARHAPAKRGPNNAIARGSLALTMKPLDASRAT